MISRDPSSFRDSESAVLTEGRRVFRAFRTEQGRRDFESFADSPLGKKALGDGSVVGLVSEQPPPPGYLHMVEVKAIHPVIDPREWSFEMRRDAALLTLELTRLALGAKLELKDASAFNVLFDGCRPVFIDHGSFRRGYSGHWPGYSQFGDHFMNPLLVEAHSGVSPTALATGVTGIPTRLARALVGRSRPSKSGSWPWIGRRLLAERAGSKATADQSHSLASAHIPKEVVAGIVTAAERTIRRLTSSAPSFWATYEDSSCPYDSQAHAAKRTVVEEMCAASPTRGLALDVGTNTGEFAEIAANAFDRVVAIDADSAAIDRLYERGKHADWGRRVQPAVVDIANPTSPIGWLNTERRGFLARLGRVDLSMWLAIIHHLILAAGIPLVEVVRLAKQISGTAIFEHIAPDDPSIVTMTAGRPWANMPTLADFKAAVGDEGMTIIREEGLSPTRTLVMVQCS